jgi:hypothetical protein
LKKPEVWIGNKNVHRRTDLKDVAFTLEEFFAAFEVCPFI